MRFRNRCHFCGCKNGSRNVSKKSSPRRCRANTALLEKVPQGLCPQREGFVNPAPRATSPWAHTSATCLFLLALREFLGPGRGFITMEVGGQSLGGWKKRGRVEFEGTQEPPWCFNCTSLDAVAGEQVSYQQSRVFTVAKNTRKGDP